MSFKEPLQAKLHLNCEVDVFEVLREFARKIEPEEFFRQLEDVYNDLADDKACTQDFWRQAAFAAKQGWKVAPSLGRNDTPEQFLKKANHA